MERRVPIAIARLIALLLGVGLATVTLLGAVGYAVFMVMWMHAPALQVVLLSTALAVPLLLLAWGAMWLGRSRTRDRE
jgi:hypothetical protein